MREEIFRSPLFYVGDKYKLIKEIRQYFPKDINSFIEPFAGGGSVFLNTNARSYFLNDIDSNVIQIHNFLKDSSLNEEAFFNKLQEQITSYNLSHSYLKDVVPKEIKTKWGKTYYAKFNKEGFNKLRSDFNKSNKSDTLKLYLLLIYGFNRMLRFNSMGNYNLPVGNVDLNSNVINALNHYFQIIKAKNITFYNLDYKDFLNQINIQKEDFIYFDPPYLITFSEYNKLWNEENERQFINYLNFLHSQGFKFAVSNVINYKGRENRIFKEWAENFKIVDIKSNYISYHDNSIKNFNEILVLNYE